MYTACKLPLTNHYIQTDTLWRDGHHYQDTIKNCCFQVSSSCFCASSFWHKICIKYASSSHKDLLCSLNNSESEEVFSPTETFLQSSTIQDTKAHWGCWNCHIITIICSFISKTFLMFSCSLWDPAITHTHTHSLAHAVALIIAILRWFNYNWTNVKHCGGEPSQVSSLWAECMVQKTVFVVDSLALSWTSLAALCSSVSEDSLCCWQLLFCATLWSSEKLFVFHGMPSVGIT